MSPSQSITKLKPFSLECKNVVEFRQIGALASIIFFFFVVCTGVNINTLNDTYEKDLTVNIALIETFSLTLPRSKFSFWLWPL